MLQSEGIIVYINSKKIGKFILTHQMKLSEEQKQIIQAVET